MFISLKNSCQLCAGKGSGQTWAVPAPPLIKPVRLSLLLARCPVGNPKTAKKCKSSFGTTASGGDHMAKAHQQARVRTKHLPQETRVFYRQKHLAVKKCANFFGIFRSASFLARFFAKRTDWSLKSTACNPSLHYVHSMQPSRNMAIRSRGGKLALHLTFYVTF